MASLGIVGPEQEWRYSEQGRLRFEPSARLKGVVGLCFK